MRALTRYACWEYLKIFLVILAGMTVFLLLIVVIREAIREGFGLVTILQFIPYVLPVSMRLSIPAAALLAASVVYGRMAGDNEIVAVKSLGISPMGMIVPSLIIAFIISLAAVGINDLAVWWGNPGMNRVLLASVEPIAYGMLRTQRSYSSDRFSINVKRVDGDWLILPTFTVYGDKGEEELEISAKKARLRSSADGDRLTVELIDAAIDGPEGSEVVSPGVFEWDIPLTAAVNQAGNNSASDYALSELPLETQRQGERIKKLERILAAQASYDIITGNFDRFYSPKWDQRHKDLGDSSYRLNRLRLEPWRRWANGFSCLAFVVVGVPLSIRLRNSDFITSFFICFLPILVIYYPLFEYGVGRAKDGTMPPYAVWLGNIICLVVGGLMLRQVTRH
jgi:lipopolysaccharide export system permease protein